MIQIDYSEWDEVAQPIFLCCLPFSVREVEDNFKVKFEHSIEEGLGDTFYSYIGMGNLKVQLKGLLSKDFKEDDKVGVLVFMRSFEESPKIMINEICSFFSIDHCQLFDLEERFEAPKWNVLRIDDNGNEIKMKAFHERAIAEWYSKQYEQKKHKQHFYVREKEIVQLK
jgi:hypothetical protein